MKAVRELSDKLQTGLPAHTTILNYREDGTPFLNEFTIIPIYDWLNGKRDVKIREKDRQSSNIIFSFEDVNTAQFGDDDYNDSLKNKKERLGKELDKNMKIPEILPPDYFVSRICNSRNAVNIPNLSDTEINYRNEQMKLITSDFLKRKSNLMIVSSIRKDVSHNSGSDNILQVH